MPSPLVFRAYLTVKVIDNQASRIQAPGFIPKADSGPRNKKPVSDKGAAEFICGVNASNLKSQISNRLTSAS